jgi:hypothetical protein
MDTNTKHSENSMETDKVYLAMSRMCPISYSANVNDMFSSLLMHAATLTHRHWLWPAKFALEGAVASEVGVPRLSHLLMLVPRSRIFIKYPEDGGDTFLRNVGVHNVYTAPHPITRHS